MSNMSRLLPEFLAGLIPGLLSLLGLLYSYGRLSQKVDVLWLAVFNHLGQNEDQLITEWRAHQRLKGKGK